MFPQISNQWQKFQTAPPWRRYLLLALAVFCAIYFLWCKFGAKPLAPGATIQATTAHEVAGMARKEVVPKRLMVLTPKAEVVKRLHLSPQEAANEDEEILDAVDVPATRYGSTSTTFTNLSTGKSRTVIKAKESPWFSFERNTTIGVEFGIGPKGRYYQGDLKRDICSIKGVTLAARTAVVSYPAETDYQAGIRAEKSFNWP